MSATEDSLNYAKILENVSKRAPAMTMGKVMGATPSIEEVFFISSIVADETKKLGLPEHWFLQQTLQKVEEKKSETEGPYKCSKCGKRYKTSDKRNNCQH